MSASTARSGGVALVGAGLLVEGASGWTLLAETSPWWRLPLAVALHGLGVALFGVGVRRAALALPAGGAADGTRPAFGALAAIVAAALYPLYGMLGILTAWALTRGRQRLDGGLLPEVEPLVHRAPARDVALLDEIGVEPLVDSLAESDVDVKRAAMDEIARTPSSEAVGMLRRLTRDPDPEVRLYASAGLSRLEDKISRTIAAAAQAQPDSSACRLELGDLYMAYCGCGFLDEVTRRYYLGLASESYRLAAEAEPAAVGAWAGLARAQGAAGEWRAARATIEHALALAPDDVRALAFHLETLFELGDFEALAREAAHLAERADAPSEWRDLAEWWRAADRAPT